MFIHYILLGLRSLRRNPALTALMVLTLAIGVAASVSTMTIVHIMSVDPIPAKSARLFTPMFDNGPLEGYNRGDKPMDRQLTYIDAMNLLKSKQGERRAAHFPLGASLQPGRTDLPPFRVEGLAPTALFFAMFDVPFVHGQGWSELEDEKASDVVVLTRSLSEKLYGQDNPVGRRVNLIGQQFEVVGVSEDWNPQPRFHRLIGGPGAFSNADEFYIPLSTAVRHQVWHNGNMSCSIHRDPGYANMLASECTWIQFWFETRASTDRAELQAYLDRYAEAQRKLGRFKRATPNELYDVREWLEQMKVVGNDSKLSAWLAFGFLLLCLVNTVGLLLAKLSARAAEVGIRRALGASRAEIFQQFMVESLVVGLSGGLLGLVLALGALALIGKASEQLAAVARMDWTMLALTFVLSVSAALLAGLLPTWRACQVTPALQLKSQ